MAVESGNSGDSEIKTSSASFSPEILENLDRLGFRVYTLAGHSIASLQEGFGIKLYTNRISGDPGWGKLKTSTTKAGLQIAIAKEPADFFIPGSNNKSFADQIKIIDSYSSNVAAEPSGFVAGTMDLLEWLEVYGFRKVEGDDLFGQRYGHRYAISTFGYRIAHIGASSKDWGLDIDFASGDPSAFVFVPKVLRPVA